MTDRIWLVRHASTEWSGHRWCGRTDLPLSAAGRAEARLLATRLATGLPSTVALVTSPARRARETADPIAQALGLEIEIDDGLWEVDFGRAEGCTWPDIERRLPGVAARITAGESEVDWPDGETSEAVRQRTRAALDRALFHDRPIVLVCHGGVIRAILASLDRERARTTVGAASVLNGSIPPGSVIELIRAGAGWAIVPTGESAGDQ